MLQEAKELKARDVDVCTGSSRRTGARTFSNRQRGWKVSQPYASGTELALLMKWTLKLSCGAARELALWTSSRTLMHPAHRDRSDGRTSRYYSMAASTFSPR